MIKINLLAVDREGTKRKTKVQAVQTVTAGCALILIGTALLLGWWSWSLKAESAELDVQITDARRETLQLQSVILQVQAFETRRAQLQQRVTLIEELRKGQTGPVHLLDEISRSLPDTMWLTQLKQTGGDVTIEGHCTTLTALSDFVGSLEMSHQFQGPVEIVDSQVVPASAPGPELIRFSVRGRLDAGR